MNILRRVEVEGFWGTKKFGIDFHPDVNFFIGVNGSGKTTLINMIAAGLSADYSTLERLSFDKINIHLADADGKHKTSVEIRKTVTDLPFPQIEYQVRDRPGGPAKKYDFDDFRRLVSREHGMVIRERSRRPSSVLVEHLSSLVHLSWLSIHRSQTLGREEKGFESTVDKKLDQMATELVKYFSLLTRRAEAEQTKFQEAVFLSLIAQQTPANLIFTEIAKLNLDEEDTALVQIFEKFGLSHKDFEPLVRQHFDMVKSALEAMNKGFNAVQLSAVLAMARIHSLVQEWKKFGSSQQVVYEPREDFLSILNRMMVNKVFSVSEKNELVATLAGQSSRLPLTELSSGEKQLLIILGEALGQQKTPCVYIADEPELSLHVDWQEQLITNLRSLNPRAQILFATHSPDIVSSYGSRVFSMEKVLA